MEAKSQSACSGDGTSESVEESSEEKRKQQYKHVLPVVDLKALKAALEEEDDDDEEADDDEGGINEDLELVGEPQRQVSAQSADDLRNGCWAVGFGPEALHGGPKVGKGMAQSAGGSLQQADCVENSTRSATVVQAEAPSNVGLTVPCEGEIAARTPKKTNGKVLTWDEETIAEHDLERGTRQKIEEPNTPWMGSPSTSGRESAVHTGTPQAGDQDRVVIVEEEVEERLHAWYKVERHRASIQEQWGELAEKCPCVTVDAEGLSEEEKKEREAAEKRKQQYKHVLPVVDLKAMRAALQDEDDDDEDEEDSEEEKM